MALRLAIANGNWTDASTWWVADSTSLLEAQQAAQSLTTAFLSSAGFTPGAITVQGICVKIGGRVQTPTTTAEIRLATGGVAVAGTTVTITLTDINYDGIYNPSNGPTGCPVGWYYCRFAAPVTLLAATVYNLQARCTTVNNQLSLFRDATGSNWARALITNTTGAPAAGDTLLIVPHISNGATATFAVTMNETAATDYGPAVAQQPAVYIGDGCSLTYPSSGGTTYRLRLSGSLNITGTGRLTMGSAGSPVEQGTSNILEFDCASAGQFGIANFPSSTVELNGSPRTAGKAHAYCRLNTDEAALQTVLGVDTDTGWLSGDDITIGTTTRTNTQTENRVLAADANAADMTVTVGLTNAHSGTSPTQATVANFTRNVIIRSVSTSFAWYWRDGSDASLTYAWAGFITCGGQASTNQVWQIGNIRSTAETTRSRTYSFCAYDMLVGLQGGNVEGGTLTWDDCVMRSSANLSSPGGMMYSGRNNITVNRTVQFYTGAVQQGGISMVGATTLRVRDSRFIGANIQCPTTAYGFGNFFTLDMEGCEFSAGISGAGSSVNTGSPDRFAVFRLVNCRFWRNNITPLQMTSSGRGDHLIQGCYFIGNATAHVQLPSGNQAEPVVRFVDCDFESEASFTTGTGVFFGTIWTGRAEFQDCRFSQVVAHTNNDIGRTGTIADLSLLGMILANNCLFGAATPVATAVTNSPGGYGRFSYMNEDGVVGAHRTLTQFGTIENQAAVFNTTQPSEQLTPTAAADVGVRGLRSSPVFKPVGAGQSVTFSVFIRRSAAHNGDMPQMIVWANGQGGWTDTRATFVGGTDVWVELTCTVGPASDESVAEACVEVDGTAGSVYIDDWSATVA